LSISSGACADICGVPDWLAGAGWHADSGCKAKEAVGCSSVGSLCCWDMLSGTEEDVLVRHSGGFGITVFMNSMGASL